MVHIAIHDHRAYRGLIGGPPTPLWTLDLGHWGLHLVAIFGFYLGMTFSYLGPPWGLLWQSWCHLEAIMEGLGGNLGPP